MSNWDIFLPLLDSTQEQQGLKLNRFKASELVRENRIRGQDELIAEHEISLLLKECVVLLLKQGASYEMEDKELVYLLPGPNTKRIIRRELTSRYRWEMCKHMWRTKVFPLLFMGIKIVFGLFLLVSLSLVALAVLALLFAASSAQRGNGGGGGGSFGGGFAFRRFYSPFRFWYCPCPVQIGGGGLGAAQVARRATATPTATMEMSFVEAVFSFVFGDLPVGGEDEEQDDWSAALRAFLHQPTKSRKFRAYQFCPFLVNPPPPILQDALVMENEQVFMSPILWRFQGEVIAANDGSALEYEFPSTTLASGAAVVVQMYREKRMVFSMASPSQLKLCLGLGIANLCLVVMLFALSKNEEFVQRAMQRGGILAGNALRVVDYCFPLFALYAVLFLCIPLFRFYYVMQRNKQIDSANSLRELWRRRVNDLNEGNKV